MEETCNGHCDGCNSSCLAWDKETIAENSMKAKAAAARLRDRQRQAVMIANTIEREGDQWPARRAFLEKRLANAQKYIAERTQGQ